MADEALNNAKDERHRERTILVEQKKIQFARTQQTNIKISNVNVP